MLHITNGDATAARIVASGLPGTVLPWRDTLHLGPIPAGLSLDALRDIRARFIADSGWGNYQSVLADFQQRDQTLISSDEHAEVVLWFEHDLYDQLQLLQVLDWFADHPSNRSHRSLICIDRFPGVEPFHGLGQLTADQIASLFPTRQPLSDELLTVASDAWTAICSPDPTTIETVLAGDTESLPFLGSALTRLLEEFPAARSGLSRTERQALRPLQQGSGTPISLFQGSNANEEAPFFGDLTFWTQLHQLSAGLHPLIASVDGTNLPVPRPDQAMDEFAAKSIHLTESGREVLAGRANAIDLNSIDRWICGVHLNGTGASWRWDDSTSGGQLLRVA